MLKSELTYLEQLVDKIMTNAVEKASDDHLLLAAFCDRQKEQWVRLLFGPVRDLSLQRFLQYHQVGIIALSDLIFASDWQKDQCKKQALESLEDLLLFMEKRLPHFFDAAYAVSHFRFDQQLRLLHLQLDLLDPILENRGVSRSLISAVKSAFDDLAARRHQHLLNALDIRYQNSLLTRIASEAMDKDYTMSRLIETLIESNFNAVPFELWLKENKPLTTERDNDAAYLILASDRAIQSMFDRTRPSFQETRSEQSKGANDSGKVKTDKLQSGSERLSLNLSVAQLALFAKLCHLEGCFQLSNISGIMRFFTRHFETKKQNDISLKSFGKAFYATEQSTAATMREHLKRMVNLIDQLYFPRN